MNMLFIFLLLLSSIFTHAQSNENKFVTRKNAIKTSPLRNTYKFNIEYERKLNSILSAGIISDIYYWGFLNDMETFGGTFKNSIYMRVYPWGNGLKGFYAQGKLFLLNARETYRINHTVYKTNENSFVYEKISSHNEFHWQYVHNAGGSIGIGYQALAGKQKRVSIDSKLEFQFVQFTQISDVDYITEEVYDKEDNFLSRKTYTLVDDNGYKLLEWYIYGPGAFIYPSVKIGYLF